MAMEGGARFKWTPTNSAKVLRHGLSVEEVEYAWDHRFGDEEFTHAVRGPYYESFGPCPSGRIIKVVWRWNVDEDAVEVVYVIKAYGRWRL